MNPLNILIEEHKSIQKMIGILKFLSQNPEKLDKIKSIFFDQIIDFFHVYADQCHHGKEEKILFEKLKIKDLSHEDRSLMNELIEEHKLARILISELNRAKEGEKTVQILDVLSKIINLYIQHIKKENIKFFPSALSYFSENEKKEILKEFIEVDGKMIHAKYLQIATNLEAVIKE
jgi:hemerythrin-like domain-containing protein